MLTFLKISKYWFSFAPKTVVEMQLLNIYILCNNLKIKQVDKKIILCVNVC